MGEEAFCENGGRVELIAAEAVDRNLWREEGGRLLCATERRHCGHRRSRGGIFSAKVTMK